MPEYVGKMLICSRCGKEVFLKKTGEHTLDGGFTGPFNDYEAKPDGWINIPELGGHICDYCSDEFKHMMYNYMMAFGKTPAPSWTPDCHLEGTTNET